MKINVRLQTALKIWLVIYPSLTTLLYLLQGAMDNIPLYGKTLILTILLVPWIVFLGLPFLDFIIRRLFPGSNNKS